MTGRNKLNGPIPNIFGEAPVDYHIKIYRKFDRIITKLGIACLRKIYESPHAFGDLRILSLRELLKLNPNILA